MKIVQKRNKNTFQIIERTIPCLDELWHYHSQYELILITKSSGIRFVGDNVSKFLPGDLVLVGPNLPHLWRNDPSYYTGVNTDEYDDGIDLTTLDTIQDEIGEDGDDHSVKTIIIKFERDFLGADFFNTPEFQRIEELLEDSKKGMYFYSHKNEALVDKIVNLTSLGGAVSILSFLDILHELSLSEDRKTLSSTDMTGVFEDKKNRQDSIIKYISDNYSDDISLDTISSVACMTPNSFCRYFKNLTNKPFSTFLNEVRIQNAVRLISLNNDNIKNISYDVGYKSVTNFNRQFKKVVLMTPMQYKQSLKSKIA